MRSPRAASDARLDHRTHPSDSTDGSDARGAAATCRNTGEVVGPGGYVYEPAGNVDSWKAVGDEPTIVHIVSFGAMEYLGDDDQILRRDSAASLRDIYLGYCREHGIPPRNLG
jgi:hypothetical protein